MAACGYKKMCCGFIIGMVLMIYAPDCGGQPRPIQAPNRFPLFWMFLAPGLMSADLPDLGSMDMAVAIDYSALYHQVESDQWYLLMDMETVVMTWSAAYAVTPRWAIGLNLPIVSTNSGFLDEFLKGFHDTFGLPNYGREERPHNEFGFQVRKNGHMWFQGRSGQTQLADSVLLLKYQPMDLAEQNGFSSLLVLGLKLPTGEPRLGFGSGGTDVGLYMPMQWRRDRWSFFLSPGATLIGSPAGGETEVNVRNTIHLSGGVSLARGNKWHWLAQADYHSSPLEQTGIAVLDNGALQLTIGCRYTTTKGLILELGFSEDPFGAVPDFTIHLGLEWNCNLNSDIMN